MDLKLYSCMARVIYENSNSEVTPHLKARATGTKGKRALMKTQEATGKGAMTRVAIERYTEESGSLPACIWKPFCAASGPTTRILSW